LPEEYVLETFKIGASYQKTDIDAKAAIERVQQIADQICLYELKLDTPFDALQFLRNEISDSSADSSPVADNPPAAD
jgi:NAD(P)H-flavin reductase